MLDDRALGGTGRAGGIDDVAGFSRVVTPGTVSAGHLVVPAAVGVRYQYRYPGGPRRRGGPVVGRGDQPGGPAAPEYAAQPRRRPLRIQRQVPRPDALQREK